MEKYIMALDAGTTSNRAIIFNKNGEICSIAQKEFKQIFPKSGWVEHDANEIWSSQFGVMMEAMAKIGISSKDLASIGITNQRETTIVWDKNTGQPVYNAIVWQCRRTANMCEELVNQGHLDYIKENTGLVLDPYFSATKIRWILDNIQDGQARAERGDLLFGTVDTWLIWKLTGGKVHVTDYSNASRTMLYNIKNLEWDKKILDILNIPAKMLANVRPSSEVYGNVSEDIFKNQVPIASAVGDQQAALFGQTCFTPGEAKNTYGTGAFLLMNTGDKMVASKNGLVTTIAWGLKENDVTYALEGSIFVAGSSIQWLRDGIQIIEKASDSEEMARKVEDTDGCYVVPAFTGLGAPYWDPFARGTIVGLTRATNRNHIVRATLESQAYLTNDVLQAMCSDAGVELKSLKVDGGASANNFLMEFQADMCQVEVLRPKVLETTALGAAYLSGLAVNYWQDFSEIRENWILDKGFKPTIDIETRNKKDELWQRAVARSFSWAKE